MGNFFQGILNGVVGFGKDIVGFGKDIVGGAKVVVNSGAHAIDTGLAFVSGAVVPFIAANDIPALKTYLLAGGSLNPTGILAVVASSTVMGLVSLALKSPNQALVQIAQTINTVDPNLAKQAANLVIEKVTGVVPPASDQTKPANPA